MLSILVLPLLLSVNEESCVLWVRAGHPLAGPPAETCRTELPGRSGKKYSYKLRIGEDKSVVLSMTDSGAMPESVLTPIVFEKWSLHRGDVFPVNGRLYVVKDVFLDESNYKRPQDNYSQIELEHWQPQEALRPAPNSLTMSGQRLGSCALLNWQSQADELMRNGVSVTSWAFDSGSESVTVNFRRFEYVDRSRRSKNTEYSLSLTEGDVFEVNGQSIRLQQIVRPRVIDKDHKLTGWISFVAVEENDAGDKDSLVR